MKNVKGRNDDMAGFKTNLIPIWLGEVEKKMKFYF